MKTTMLAATLALVLGSAFVAAQLPGGRRGGGPPGGGPENGMNTRPPNAPDQKPAFQNQTRAPEQKLNVAFDVVTVDVSFISLRHILPVLPPLLAPSGSIIVLVKPQFEAGRDEVGAGGIVRDPVVHARVVDEVTSAAHQVGLVRAGVEPSPITGAEGNREFLMRLVQTR